MRSTKDNRGEETMAGPEGVEEQEQFFAAELKVLYPP